MIKYLLFDFDGTLVDSLNVIIRIYTQLAEKHEALKEALKKMAGLRELPLAKRSDVHNLEIYQPRYLSDVYRLYGQSIKDLVFFDGIKDLVAELDGRGIKLGIISSNAEENIREFLRCNQINFINDILCSRDFFGKDKVLRSFIEAKKLKESEVILVGDEVRDIMAAQKSGIKSIWVSWGYDQPENARQAHPDYMVYSPREIINCL